MAGRVDLPSEMLSGPDLGGGYLHQLSFDRGDATTFTFHAQEGGQDAGGPPPGPLDPLGFAHPTRPCLFGGPRCWHRRFLLPLDAAPGVRRCYNRTRFVFETMLAQLYRGTTADLATGLREVVGRVGPALEAEGIEWYLGGSTAARLLGADVAPRDIDLGTTRAGVDRIGALLEAYLIEPVAATETAGRRIVRGGRAFVGTFANGIRVEWAVPIDRPAQPGAEEFGGVEGSTRTLPGSFEGRSVRLSRPEYGLVRAAEHGRTDHSAALTRLLRTIGPDRELLTTLLDRSSLEPASRDAVLASLSSGRA
jgi:hypothetical protein